MRRKELLKRTGVAMMAVCMAFSMTGCKKGGNKNGNNTALVSMDEIKDVTFKETDVELTGYVGEISSAKEIDGKLYFITVEYPEADVNTYGPGVGKIEEVKREPLATAATEAETETSSEEGETEAQSEETSEDTTEAEISEETSAEGSTELTGEDYGEMSDEDISAQEEEPIQSYVMDYKLYTANLDGTDVKELTYPTDEPTDNIVGIDKTADGDLIFLAGDYSSEFTKYKFIIADENGNKKNEIDINSTVDMGDDSYVSNFFVDDKGNIVLSSDEKMFILGKDYKKKGELKAENGYFSCCGITKDNKVVAGVEESAGNEATTKAFVKVVDTDAGKFTDSYPIDTTYFQGSDSIIKGTADYDFYYKTDKGIFGYIIAEKKTVKVLDFIASDVANTNIYGLAPLSDGSFIYMTYGDDAKSHMKHLIKADPNEVANKEVITFGSMYSDFTIKNAAIEFNKKSDKYKVIVKDYSDEEDPETKFNADLAAGNIPDVIGMDSYSSTPDKYLAKNLLEDLSPYMEKDPDINESDFLPNYIKATKKNDKLYYLATSFNISTIAARKSELGDKTGWDVKEFTDMAKEKEKSGERAFTYDTRSSRLNMLFAQSSGDYVNWETGETKFDTDDFKSILEYAKGGEDDESFNWENVEEMPQAIQNKHLFLSEMNLDFEQVELYNKIFNGDMTFIGYPTADKNGTYITIQNSYGIYSKSDKKDGAWEFIKSLMTKEGQYKISRDYGNSIPTRLDVFDMKVKAVTATEEYKDEFGNDVYPFESGYGWGENFSVDLKPLTDEEVKMTKDIINNTTKISTYNSQIFTIISEEAEAFFKGDKTVDEVAKIINNRVSNYVNENR
ncbi:MAG: extracellular solute-binding protein [Lachnospiraceae bacterium]|nr:extracellular solute-binding protein [Lachnospiraceae bacterium]